MSELKKNHADLLKKLYNYKSPLTDRAKLHNIRRGDLLSASFNDIPDSCICTKGRKKEVQGMEAVNLNVSIKNKQMKLLAATF